LGLEAAEDVPQLAQQRRALFELGRELRPSCTTQCANTTEVEPEESKALTLCQVDGCALVFVDLDLQFG
jgi:hypothetical protein